MRSIIACGIVLLGLTGTAHEPNDAWRSSGRFATENEGSAAPIEIVSSTGRSDRLAIVSLRPRVLALQIFRPTAADLQLRLAAGSDLDMLANEDAGAADTRGGDVSLDDLCQALFTSAQANDIPVQFFANLIWQESRLNPDDVSKKGAMGIAQFMPQVAAEKGLDNPFDPMQAIPASARLLRELRMEFGNLGLVAAAYNAGPVRVIRWLERRVSLPRETRNYVVRVTGLSVDAWRDMRVNDDALTFVQHLPCRSMPAFANVEQEQEAQTQAKIEQAKLEEPEITGAIDDMPALRGDRKAARKAEGKFESKLESKSVGKAARGRGKHEPRRLADSGAAVVHAAGKPPVAKRENAKSEVDRHPHNEKRRV